MKMRVCVVVLAAALATMLVSAGCTRRAIRFDECRRHMEHSGLCTESGTSKERLVSKFGEPDDVLTSRGGCEVLHYKLSGTLTTTTAYPIVGEHVKDRDVEENIYVEVENGVVTGGRWVHYDGGVSRWGKLSPP